MKFKGKIERIEYKRWNKYTLCPGSLWFKNYFVGNNKIEIAWRGIFDWKKYTKRQSRPFLDPDGQK